MKITVGIYNIETLKKVAPIVDAAILNIEDFSCVYDRLDIDSSIEICKKNNVEPIISINKIVLEDELINVKEFIQKYKDYTFIISDLGVAQICKELGIINNIIFDSPTMLCNSLDLELYSNYGFKAVSLSNEITLKDVIDSYNESKANIFYQVFGRKLMFYSKRRLVDLYKEFRNLSFENKDLTIKEEKRIYEIPIIQTKNGTFCYRQYLISQLDRIIDLNFLSYAYFESLRLDDETLFKVIGTYKKVIDKKITVEEGLKEISSLSIDIEEGFNYDDSVPTKEEVIQWKE